jgi:predicted nucleotidyltransferase
MVSEATPLGERIAAETLTPFGTAAQSHGASNLRVFGSVARGENERL